ncbi:shikimate kinase [Clostridium gasigenes]|uniref:shikimate kinase n=1 Tax=Clostridium gasigenes TaxID=94869 RepID=UPI0014382DEE|nr:shikimate kinase [Clostridium gasigenes]NKF07511.1 shikimate kinase [Clostridium gasigenes]QSW17949.1 shikimate kinase [Clostridium gasigenes]
MSDLKDKVLLIGMPGCGKTTIGKLLATKLNYNFCDMDKYIEDISGETVKELFEKGEENFRKWENKACVKLSKKRRVIISSGGGVIKNEKNIDLFREESIIIFIDRPLDNIIEDVNIEKRPLLSSGKEKLYNIFQERYELYNKYCHIKIVNNGFLKDIIFEIQKELKERIRK